MKYRSKTDIIAMILRAANNGATKTKLMYSAYLSYVQVVDYIEFLLAQKLLQRDPQTELYGLTERGIHYLRVYEKIIELMNINPDVIGQPEMQLR
jgi:predicted transcriptional regulator